MKIGIIGAGFTGLSAALQLLKEGHSVTIFEKDKQPGGLAMGYKEKNWDWTLEKHYHHWFSNSEFILNLAKEISYPVLIKTPKTSVYVKNKIYELDSPLAFLQFPLLSISERLRMVIILAFLRFNPIWGPLEKINANKFLKKTMGEKAYGMLWEPQLRNKMGKYADDVSLVWFWSRIRRRSPKLAYPEGGFLSFAIALSDKVEKLGGKIYYNSEIVKIIGGEKPIITTKNAEAEIEYTFDKIIVTLPSFTFLKLAPELDEKYKSSLVNFKGLSATNLVLRLSKPFLPDKTYWLSICENNSPIMVIVEHTNFIDKKNYNNEHLVYIGNYAKTDDKLNWTKEQILNFYDEFLKKINPNYKNTLLGYDLFTAPFAQPIIPENYSKLIPSFVTPLKNVFLANMQQVYPWDRETNYAVELGEKVTKFILSS